MVMVPLLTAGILGIIPTTAFGFAPRAGMPRASCDFERARWILHSTSVDENDQKDDKEGSLFDPFLQSPHSFGSNDDGLRDEGFVSDGGFSFLSDGDGHMSNVPVPEPSLFDSATVVAKADADLEFDPLLSPHAYANGIEADPVDDASPPIITNQKLDSAFGFLSSAENDVDAKYHPESSPFDSAAAVSNVDADIEFDPLLSPHTYANGIEAGPVEVPSPPIVVRQKLGVLLVDRGSERRDSNENIHCIARMYQERLNRNTDEEGAMTVVRAAHLDFFGGPSIIDSLRDIAGGVDGATRVVCVPYFLSTGASSAAEDVSVLVREAREELAMEGLAVDLLVSDAIGTHFEGMMGAVNDLVQKAIDEG